MIICSCKTCLFKGNPQPLENFYIDKSKKRGFSSRCKECSKNYNKTDTRLEYGRNYRKRPEIQAKTKKYNQVYCKNYNIINKENRKSKRFEKKYNITLENYYELLKLQNEKCKICQCHISDSGKKSLVVDHCHKTGKVRGLLCTWCNSMLGYAKDNIESLKSAIKYLNET